MGAWWCLANASCVAMFSRWRINALSMLPLLRSSISLPELHGELLQMARDEAQLILSQDPKFKSRRADALRHLLYLFGRDDAVRLMRAG